MAKGKQQVRPGQAPAGQPRLVVAECPLFRETAAKYARGNPLVLQKYVDFLKTKQENPIAPFGSSDKRNAADSPMSQEVPGIKHAHLTHDVSVFYTLSGANPAVLRVYAILTHDEAGTGQPTNRKVQKSVAQRMSNQTFQI